ncbi:hypothetical protein GQ55_5G208000 [Panicum hallii var. hallii]|uniref:Uncharacterized protein n=1 Tax=Panicum hallii var. hallii TaxID=1504633 RepID=A0A2T7DII4_9POAL|nr:hypothetical protein GQ55_5G208000 [Panicum hallii var. hallii]
MPPCFAGAKRPLEMVVYDPAAAASKRARQDEATTSAAAADSAGEPLDVLDVEPISAIPPQLPPPPPPLAGREAAPCLRRHFLEALGLRADLPFVTSTDLDPHQNRFRIPGAGVKRRLRAILTPRELDEANLLRDPTPRSRTRHRASQAHPAPPPSEPRNVAAEGEQPPGKKIKKPKRKGKVHGGLRVKLVDLHAGAKELLMSRRSSSKGTIVKGRGYLDFIRRCGFKEKDVVEVWAFVERRFRLFGADLCDDGPLHVLVVKKDQQQPGCCYCCPLPHPTHRS